MANTPGDAYQDQKKPDPQPHQNPGKDKNHPGDKAADRASTEPQEGQPAKR
jgi:hypothetical protein